jgi:hypothetical protein
MLLGREDEIQHLDALLGGARTRTSGVLVLQGEPGIGKTTLLDYAAGRAASIRILRATELALGFHGAGADADSHGIVNLGIESYGSGWSSQFYFSRQLVTDPVTGVYELAVADPDANSASPDLTPQQGDMATADTAVVPQVRVTKRTWSSVADLGQAGYPCE